MMEESDRLFDTVLAALTGPGQQLEVAEASIDGVTLPVFKNAPPSMAGYFMLALRHADADFIVYEGERYSYGEAYRRAEALARYLQDTHAIAKGDRVVLAMRNYPEWLFAFMALMMAGAVAVPLNAWWQADELAFALADSGARLAIADEARAERLATVPHDKRPPVLVVRGEVDLPDGMTRLEDLVFTSGKTPRPVAIAPEDDASIIYTSGSTGSPKGAVSTQRAMVSALLNYGAIGLTQLEIDRRAGKAKDMQQAVLLTVPLFHVTGLIPVALVSFLIGRKIVMMHKWDVSEAFRLMESERVTYFIGVPTMSLELLQHPKRDSYDLSALADIGGGGAARPAAHVKRLKEAFPGQRPGLGYGLTETNGVGAINSREGYLKRPASTGRASKPMVEIGIFDEAGKACVTGEVGEICLRSAANVRGYWNRPQDTASAFTPDGWFKSGDLGYLDDAGYLYIVDRKKDIIIRGGENISCLEVEAALYHHPAVAEASVFGLSDERLGEVVGAVVFLKPGETIEAEALRDFVARNLAAFKVPTRLWLAERPLPKLGSGKIDKVALRQRYGGRPKAS
ncbi:MAG: class I adenylate-forming enzyme family protein [Pseudomonadota bacterium]